MDLPLISPKTGYMALLNGRWYERLVIVPFIANQTSASMIFPGKQKTETVPVLKIPMGSYNQVRPVLRLRWPRKIGQVFKVYSPD